MTFALCFKITVSRAIYDHIHAAIQSNNMRLRGNLTGMCETNVNWRNYTFRDKWETKISRGLTDMRFSLASCNQRYEAVLQHGGVIKMCTLRMFSRLLEQGSDQELLGDGHGCCISKLMTISI